MFLKMTSCLEMQLSLPAGDVQSRTRARIHSISLDEGKRDVLAAIKNEASKMKSSHWIGAWSKPSKGQPLNPIAEGSHNSGLQDEDYRMFFLTILFVMK